MNTTRKASSSNKKFGGFRVERWSVAPALIAAGLACAPETVERAPVARPVKMLTLGGGAAGGVREYPGSIQAAQSSEIAFEVAGRIVELPVDEGTNVRKGDLLARLDPADFQAALDADKARMNMAKAEYDRYQTLYADNAVSLQELEVKRRNFEVTEARVRTAEKALNDTRLRAPFDGRVARKFVENFQNVRGKETILILQDLSGLEIVVHAPETDMILTASGLNLEERTERARPEVRLSSLPGRSFPARIKEVANQADPVTRTYDVTLAFDPPGDVEIRPGMTAKIAVQISGQEESRFSVPAGAVASDENGDPYVWKVDPDAMTVSRTPVTVGEMSGSEIDIRSGLQPGDRIAVSGVHNLREGMPVRPME
jgi:RND family efflux transporter MFP subunit